MRFVLTITTISFCNLFIYLFIYLFLQTIADDYTQVTNKKFTKEGKFTLQVTALQLSHNVYIGRREEGHI